MLKKMFFLMVATLVSCTNSFAANIHVEQLKISGVPISNTSLSSGVAVTSDGIRQTRNIGFSSLIVKENKSGGAGDVDIYVEYSIDGSSWIRAYTSDMAGTATIEGNIVTGLGNTTDPISGASEAHLIAFTPRLMPWTRFVFDPDAASQITAHVIFQEED